MVVGDHPTSYSCRCLNVRIYPRTPPSPSPSDTISNGRNDYTPVYVGEEGITVMHNQLTLRYQSCPIQPTQSQMTAMTRYTSLTCLICQVIVYRVLQEITPDLDGMEGPVLPTDDWAEQYMLKSPTGWIEVSDGCLTGESITQAEASDSYSRTFCVILPSDASSSTVVPSHSAPFQPCSPRSPESNTYLPALPPLFLPPPFRPSHQVFSYLSSVATARSEKLRASAEEYLAKVVQEKVAEIRIIEEQLRDEVELLWAKFKDTVDQAEREATKRGHPVPSRRRHSSAKWLGLTSHVPGLGANATSSSVRINNFVPSPVPAPQRTSTSQRASALSASLATSSFHYPAAQAQPVSASPRSSPSRSPSPHTSSRASRSRSSRTRVASPSAASSRTMAMAVNGHSLSIRDAHRRNMDESIDIATSFKYVMGMEEMARRQQEEEASQPEASLPVATQGDLNQIDVPRGRSPRVSKSAAKQPMANGEAGPSQAEHAAAVIVDHAASDGTSSSQGPSSTIDAEHSSNGSSEKSSSKARGKRKVTFDVEPEVAIIRREVASEPPAEVRGQGIQESVFDMEGEDGNGDRQDAAVSMSSTAANSSAPASEPVRAPERPSRVRPNHTSGLPSSFSALRPASLPLPSAVRQRTSLEPSDERLGSSVIHESVMAAEKVGRPIGEDSPRYIQEEASDPVDPRDATILRLVAASTPSHRSAWKKDSKAWQLFTGRQVRKGQGHQRGSIIEEDETSTGGSASSHAGYVDSTEDDSGLDDDQPENGTYVPIASSLPIPIAPLSQHKKTPSLASHQPTTSLGERPDLPVVHRTASAVRRAMYAERDRSRDFDPGALDFTVDGDEDEDDIEPDIENGGKGRQRALKILEARNEIPDAGMWRSLA